MSIDKRLAIKPALNQFNGGEISPYLEGRYDWDKYNYSAKLCKNFIPTVEGYLKRRGGSHFVAIKRGSGKYSFKIRVRTDDHTQPTLTINGETVTLTQITSQTSSNPPVTIITDLWETDVLTYLDGTKLVYIASATGFLTKSGTITVDINQQNVELDLNSSQGEQATVEFIIPTTATITLNGTSASSITAEIGTLVTYNIAFSGATATGSITITEDKKYFVYKVENELVVTDSEILLVGYPSNGTIYLPYCKIRYIGVGGGGGALYDNTGCFSGGSGAGCDVILNIDEGNYDWSVGVLGSSGSESSVNFKGGDTYLKHNNTNIIVNGGGNRLFGTTWTYGSNTINNSYVSIQNWAREGNKPTFISQDGFWTSPADSIYNGYGAASGCLQTNSSSFRTGTCGYLYLSFVEE